MKHGEFFIISPEDVYHDMLYIKGPELKHLSQVLRKKIGDAAAATDGQGNVYDFIITQISKDRAEAEIQKRRRLVGEPFFHLNLAQAVLKGNHFEMIVEKGTEIGVSTFTPMTTENTIPEVTGQKLTRYQRIACEAMKQCCRSIIPLLQSPQSFEEILENSQRQYVKLIAHPGREAMPVKLVMEQYRQKINSLKLKSGILLVGPEGGFSDTEYKTAVKAGFQPISLSKRRLRAETAGLVGATLVLEHMGEF